MSIFLAASQDGLKVRKSTEVCRHLRMRDLHLGLLSETEEENGAGWGEEGEEEGENF